MASSFTQGTYSNDLNVNIGGQASEFRYSYKIDFDTTQWHAVNFGLAVNANQTFAPSPLGTGTVNLITTGSYSGLIGSANLNWNSLDYTSTKANNFLKTMNAGTGKQLDINLSYQVPQTVLTPAVCNFSVYATITFESSVSPPSSYPSSTLPTPTVTADGGQEAPKWPWDKWTTQTKLIVAGAGVLALVLIIRPSAPATIISSGVREYRRTRSKRS
jgi:hypothetical protein